MHKVLMVIAVTVAVAIAQDAPQTTPATGSISGVVKDEGTGSPMPEVQISVNPTQTETTTDSQGRYTLRGLAPGTYRVAAHGQTDQNGVYFSDMLAPGKYLVLANSAPVDSTPESIGKLWRSRSHAQEVEIAANVTAQVTLPPVALE